MVVDDQDHERTGSTAANGRVLWTAGLLGALLLAQACGASSSEPGAGRAAGASGAQSGRGGNGAASGKAGHSAEGGDSSSSCDDLECVDGQIELASCPGKPFVECDRDSSGVECVESGQCPVLSEGGQGGASGGEGGGGGAQGGSSGAVAGPAPERFCQAWIDAFAALVARCDCGDATVARYRELAASLCEPTGFLGSLAAGVATGDLRYDAEAAGRLLTRLERDGAPCVKETFLALGLDSGVCASDGAGAGACIEFVGENAECDASGDENLLATVRRLCHDRRPPDVDGEYASAFSVLSCVALTSGSTVRTCVRGLPDGQSCTDADQCLSGLCSYPADEASSGTCEPRRANGEPCAAHLECASGACASGEPRRCGSLLVDGEPCDFSDAACASGFCNWLVDGVSPFCAPAPSRRPGESCASGAECVAERSESLELCDGGRCIRDVCATYAE
jgi:hypothetical protein